VYAAETDANTTPIAGDDVLGSGEFITFQIKVVMNSSDTSKVPRLKNFRAIALT
jgi:hypothetical protein